MKKGDLLWIAVLCAFTALLAIPATHGAFIAATDAHPYLMGFIKFALLATMGELLAVRLAAGKWSKLPGMPFKVVIWGIIGILIVLMFTLYSAGVAGAAGKNLLFVGSGFYSPFLKAFYTSVFMEPDVCARLYGCPPDDRHLDRNKGGGWAARLAGNS